MDFYDPDCRDFRPILSDARWDMNRLWQTLAQMLINRFYPQGVIPLALDDTVFHHSSRKIEETFKGVKQLLGGQEPQTWKRQGPKRAAGLSLWLYSMVWLWYLNQKASERYVMAQPWYAQKVTPSFADAIAGLRRRLWREKIKYMFGNAALHNKKFEFLLEALAPAA